METGASGQTLVHVMFHAVKDSIRERVYVTIHLLHMVVQIVCWEVDCGGKKRIITAYVKIKDVQVEYHYYIQILLCFVAP